MTIIVGSLFLPYQPQFELSISQADALDDLIDPNLVKVSTNVPDLMKKQREMGSREIESPVFSRELSPVPTSNNKELTTTSSTGVTNTSKEYPIYNDDMVSSKVFMDNLTTHASALGSPVHPIYSLSRNASVDKFFTSNTNIAISTTSNNIDSQLEDQVMDSPKSINSITQPNQNANPSNQAQDISKTGFTPDSTAALLKNVNKSLLYQSLFKNNSQTSLDSFTHYPIPTSSNSAVITPKSKTLLDHHHSTVFNYGKSKNNTSSTFPSVRRLNKAATIANTGTTTTTSLSSTSKMHQPQPQQPTSSTIFKKELNRSMESIVSSKYEEETTVGGANPSDIQLSSGSVKNKVPKFGGYSKSARLKASVLNNSHDIFKSIPWRIVTAVKGNGGLKNAIETAVIEETIIEPVKWVGTVGIPTDEVPQDILDNIIHSLEEDYDSYSVISDDITFKGAYKSFSKQILWPTFHYQIPDNPLSKAFEDHSWSYYKELNQKFADKIVKMYKPGDTIWIHDYHLMLVPLMIRKKLPNAKIGFFLHVSFPSSEVFRCLAQRDQILEGICGANFVGFQTKEYARHFLQTTNRILVADIGKDEVKYNGTIISVKSTPIGIDMFHLQRQMKTDKTIKWRQLIRERWNGKKLIICRDQFDRVRGLNEKMLAYERFLKENPEWIDRVVLIQICIGYRKDDDLEKKVMLTVDRINALSSDLANSQHVVFLHQDLEFAQYLALSCEADAFLITAFREGMNLTAQEFVGCSEEKNAPLLLSEFTGSAELLKDGAILINPWAVKSLANAIKRGLEMSEQEKRRNWKKMSKNVIAHDSDLWVTNSIEFINKSWNNNKERLTSFYLNSYRIIENYKDSKKHMFILKLSQPPTSRVLAILNELSIHNIVYVINSFSKGTTESLYNRVLNLGLIAENGAYVRLNGSWYNIVEKVDWKSEVVKIFDDKVERLPGSYYKISESMVRFHTENALDQERVASVVGEAMTHINTLFDGKGIHAYLHDDVVFVQQTDLVQSAASFLLQFYNSTTEDIDRTSLPTTPAAIGGLKELQNQQPRTDYFETKGISQFHVDFLCVTGSSSPVSEPLFQVVKKELNECDLKYGHSIVYGNSTSTNAKEHVVGSNELFTILDRLSKIKKNKLGKWNI
ncbi:hypothetical protein TBLA_0B03050 [Henningerozyma blattae CBS 6284]|uniref:Uncharacterized protein n=1 Tax=Henningerozyma blattae (strain ATCC 34711 / CBS 6284 / DSM 70876 / NBRC 10599 / NRRL Y-10934 / UCD 77-7) TaxID=1071380 RepID=I2GYE5_HENB6|nr:hypothetical protein TBLA_0B03050 [Tetrapisispora blattae CBS 6284]CCH59147.1 hypothetical protein TBLA_0B03050 [Tetrapisispora blattae CBS 6284]